MERAAESGRAELIENQRQSAKGRLGVLFLLLFFGGLEFFSVCFSLVFILEMRLGKACIEDR